MTEINERQKRLYRFLVKVERMTKDQYESIVGEEYVEEELETQ